MSKVKACGGGLTVFSWFTGWIFTLGFLKLAFLKGVLAIILWPYYLGVFFSQM
ncbi:MAG: hypothetical protein K9M15_02265 [Candidatus Marinimicrobia bacterium]|nr:hypothetical protein [Candidatus Neomarinimicrobiota bacterium]